MFQLVQCFKTFSLSHIQRTLCIFIHPFNFYSFIYTCSQSFVSSHIKCTKIKNYVIYLQPFNDTYITLILQYYVILTCMSRLWPRKEACVFYSMTIAYSFDVEVKHCGFFEVCDSLWVFGCLGFWFGKVINEFCFRTK